MPFYHTLRGSADETHKSQSKGVNSTGKAGNMNIVAVTLKAMENTPAEEFENIARMQKKFSKSIEEKKAYVINQIGKDISKDLPDEFFEHTYRAMWDYGMSVYDADKWAWLNTLFGYDIGAERALGLITWYDDNGMDVLDLKAGDKETIRNVAEMELGYHFNYEAFAPCTPDMICYSCPSHI